jgi:hypothetical protein
MTNEEKMFKKLKADAERLHVLENNDLPPIRWALEDIAVSPIPAYPGATFFSESLDETDEDDNQYVLKLCMVAAPSADPSLRNAVMFPIVLMSKLHNSSETICKVIGTILRTEQLALFKDWKSKDTPEDVLPFVIRLHTEKTERIGEDDGFMYYVSVHIELEPERYEQVCYIYSKIFENVFASQNRGLRQ